MVYVCACVAVWLCVWVCGCVPQRLKERRAPAHSHRHAQSHPRVHAHLDPRVHARPDPRTRAREQNETEVMQRNECPYHTTPYHTIPYHTYRREPRHYFVWVFRVPTQPTTRVTLLLRVDGAAEAGTKVMARDEASIPDHTESSCFYGEKPQTTTYAQSDFCLVNAII